MLSLRAGPPRLVLRAAVGRQMPFPSAQIARRPGASAWSHLARVAWRLQKHDSACETTVCDENDRRRRRESTHRVVNKACGFDGHTGVGLAEHAGACIGCGPTAGLKRASTAACLYSCDGLGCAKHGPLPIDDPASDHAESTTDAHRARKWSMRMGT